MEDHRDWDKMVGIFVWSIRTSSKLFNGVYTPYEVITGLKPRSPIDAVFFLNVAPERVTASQYVADLVKYLKQVHKHVDAQHELVRDNAERAKLRELGTGAYLSVDEPGTANDLFVTFENPRSIQAKVDYVHTRGLGGIAIWELAAGYERDRPAGERDELLQAVKTAVDAVLGTNKGGGAR